MGTDFYLDAENRAKRCNMRWYHKNLMPALERAKEIKVRDIDVSIKLADKLLKILNEPVEKPIEVVPRTVEHSDDLNLMRPIEPEVLDLIYKSKIKGFGERYLNQRYKKLPEDRYYGRVTTSFDYGWHLEEARMPARDFLRGRCAILRDTFYRKRNLAPDDPSTMMPSCGEVSTCSNYSCYFN